MLDLFNDLFFNLCVLFSLIFIYLQLRWKIQLEKRNYLISVLIDGVAGGLLGIILMYYSIQVTQETIVDLRYIPVMLVIMFLGLPQALISTILIIIGRFIFGFTTSAVAAFIMMAILMLGFVFINKLSVKYNIGRHSFKKSLAMILFSNIVFSVFIYILVKDYGVLKSLIPSYWIISIVGGFTSVFFVEYIRKTQYLLMKYEEESTTDFLTGLNNVRQFDAIWNSLIDNATTKGEKLSLLFIDIDHFKHVNDTYGHPVGDMILAELGKILKNTTRSFDVVSRNGGEEFSVILPDSPHPHAMEIAERIRKAVEAYKFNVSKTELINITVSIGVATYPETVSDRNEMVYIADECLYKAKRTGRNRVCDNTYELLNTTH
ncbi:GGDEF domain-containing protein [Bacillus sp. CHD6a]|uniref:GGDEF domain-containing protein n=1 Tax=Bacillus sp. CHD6a TaxID=1643452 RepID=UPI0006CCEC19|nr:diguanylate cyclase [Bacillus sp. CHD6a]KPB04521.1 diguanylate cyclase [Bacillus sp. CHD6a]